jgi:hypothetical protein
MKLKVGREPDMDIIGMLIEERDRANREASRLRKLVRDLTPFMVADVQSALEMGPPPGDHNADNCEDCRWYEQALSWKARIDAGEISLNA